MQRKCSAPYYDQDVLPTPAGRELCRLLDDAKIGYLFIQVNIFRIRRPPPPMRPKGISRQAWRRRARELRPDVFIELDGASHIGREAYDRRAMVLRFTNEDVFQRPAYVLATIGRLV